MKPVYVINGFLEAGKSEFITYTLSQPYFQVRGKTLLLLCEEGEVEYDSELLRKTRTEVEVIEDEEQFNAKNLMELEKKHKPERIVIEWNGMWNYRDVKFPFHWSLEQQITIINGATFAMYYANMKSLLFEMVKKSELIIFNRCDGIKDLSTYKRNIKMVNNEAQIVFEDSNGEVNEIMEEELPYDVKQSSIELNEQQFCVWYMDMMDHPERYAGKEITYLAQAFKPDSFPKGYFVAGRMAMTCCAQDVSFIGYATEYKEVATLENKQWIRVTVKPTTEYFAPYQGEGPILHVVKVEAAKKPKEEVINFV